MPLGNLWQLNHFFLNADKNPYTNSFFYRIFSIGVLGVLFVVAVYLFYLINHFYFLNYHLRLFICFDIFVEIYIEIMDKSDFYKH